MEKDMEEKKVKERGLEGRKQTKSRIGTVIKELSFEDGRKWNREEKFKKEKENVKEDERRRRKEREKL